jgi:exportin-2 (importin alpha re-exporter)
MLLVEGNMGGQAVEVHLRMAGAVLFKNFIRNHWHNEATGFITAEERSIIKGSLVTLMLGVPANVQAQLSEALVAIASFDFPQDWPDLISSLVTRLGPTDFALNNAVLRTLHRIFKRYRSESRSDELYSEINFVMGQMGPTLLSLYRSLAQLVDANSSGEQLLPVLLESQILCNRVFLSLSSQDLPAFFEDHLGEFMGFLEKHLLYKNPAVVSEDAERAGVLERLPASVAKIITLYALKYEEDFPQLPQFVQLSWAVLTGITQDPKDDGLAGSAMAFLTTVAKQERHSQLFGPVLQLICDKVVLPNMLFREGDLELFEDEPLEFIRRDQEVAVTGDGQHSRRGGAVSLARGLMEFYETEVTTILASYLEQYLGGYAESPGSKWREKDVAIQLFSAIAIKGTVALYGVTRVNDMIDIGDFFRQHILPDLQPVNEALHPILKMDAIKFLNAFRNQLGRDALVGAFPLLMHHVASHNHVIHTYAAMAVERILAIKSPGGSLLFSPADLKQVVEPLCVGLLRLMTGKRTAERMAENEHLMKALMRVLLLAQRDLLRPILGRILAPLGELLFQVARNPSNPRFNHFMFEAVAALVKEVGPVPECLAQLEATFVPLLQGVLAEDVADFVPYAFQLLAGLVEVRPSGALPPFLAELFAAVLQPVLWAASGNAPALVRLLQAGLLRDPAFFAPHHLQTLLGIYQTLMAGRANDIHAFALLSTLLQAMPQAQMQPFLQPALMLVLKKLQAGKTTRNAVLALLAICNAAMCFSPAVLFGLFEGIQPRMLIALMRTVLLPAAGKIRERQDRKLVQVALARFVVDCEPLLGLLGDADYASLWLAMLSTDLSLLANSKTQAEEIAPIAYDPSSTASDGDEISGGAAFSRLQVLPHPPKYPYLEPVDPLALLATGIVQRAKQLPAAASLLESGLDAEHRALLQALLRQASLSL